MAMDGKATAAARGHRAVAAAALLWFAASPLLLFPARAGAAPEVQVTTAAIPDYEFDSARNGVFCASCNFGTGNARLVFADANNQLWLGYVDFATGAFVPPDGRGVLLDTDAAAATDYGNGPEWLETATGSGFVYTKYLPGQPHSDATAAVALATMNAGGWTTRILSNGVGRASPAGTLDPGDPDARINYVTSVKGKWYWRRLSQIDTENELPLSSLTDGNSRRWVPGTRKIIFQGHPPDDPQILRDQIYLYDTETGELEQLTFNPNGVVGAMMWRAPEFKNEYVFFTMAKFRQEILVYRKLPGADRVLRWTIVKTISAPPALPYFFSPEVFVHNGRSYIFTEASSSSKFFDRTVPNQIAISGVDPLRNDFRMLTTDTATPRLRLDPEYFITAQGPFIYYNRAIPETDAHPAINDGVWRVDTGLGPPR